MSIHIYPDTPEDRRRDVERAAAEAQEMVSFTEDQLEMLRQAQRAFAIGDIDCVTDLMIRWRAQDRAARIRRNR